MGGAQQYCYIFSIIVCSNTVQFWSQVWKFKRLEGSDVASCHALQFSPSSSTWRILVIYYTFLQASKVTILIFRNVHELGEYDGLSAVSFFFTVMPDFLEDSPRNITRVCVLI